jgi:hypothetical protein
VICLHPRETRALIPKGSGGSSSGLAIYRTRPEIRSNFFSFVIHSCLLLDNKVRLHYLLSSIHNDDAYSKRILREETQQFDSSQMYFIMLELEYVLK